MYPFASADSTNVTVNVPKTKRFPMNYRQTGTLVLRAAIERCTRHPDISMGEQKMKSRRKPVLLIHRRRLMRFLLSELATASFVLWR